MQSAPLELFGAITWVIKANPPQLQDKVRRREIVQPSQTDRHFDSCVIVIINPHHRMVVSGSYDIKLLKANLALCCVVECSIPLQMKLSFNTDVAKASMALRLILS